MTRFITELPMPKHVLISTFGSDIHSDLTTTIYGIKRLKTIQRQSISRPLMLNMHPGKKHDPNGVSIDQFRKKYILRDIDPLSTVYKVNASCK